MGAAKQMGKGASPAQAATRDLDLAWEDLLAKVAQTDEDMETA